ncbi:insulin-like growth factor-binding protein 6 [Nelusetta ayraudi]|uniref:insulin-like growth factor-binding protein 6 n=1 Tax=Nelusetta ayraudi TaxID=303726 RepID=UPI003F6E6E3B
MFQYLNLLPLLLLLLLLQLDLTRSLPLTTASRECPTCVTKPAQTQAPEYLNGTSLGIDEPCGVYTMSCAPGLRCAPPQGELGPLRALLEGRGVCSNASGVAPTQNTRTAGLPVTTEDPNEAPCRKLLTTLISDLEAHLFDTQHDIYMPNCDKRGFFRKKQCWSSRGKRRGKCWCVDMNGMMVASKGKQKGSQVC